MNNPYYIYGDIHGHKRVLKIIQLSYFDYCGHIILFYYYNDRVLLQFSIRKHRYYYNNSLTSTFIVIYLHVTICATVPFPDRSKEEIS